MSDTNHVEGDNLENALLSSASPASGDVFEVVDVMVKEEPAELDVVIVDDPTSLPGPSSEPLVQDDQSMNDGTASFRCPKCVKTFRDLRRLKRHDRDVHALVRIKCEICNYSSARKDHLQRHYQCWHKERWCPSMGWWKRAKQKNRTRSKMLLRPEGTRRGSSGNLGNMMSKQRSSSAPRTNVHPISSRGRSSGLHIPRMSASALPTSLPEPDMSILWSSLPEMSSPASADVSVSLESPLSSPVAMATSSSHTPPLSASSVLSLLQPSASSSPPLAMSSALFPRVKPHDPDAVACSVTPVASTSTVSILSPRTTAILGKSPQIVSLLRNASPTGLTSTACRSSSSALTSTIPASSASSASSPSLSAASPNSSVPSSMSPRAKQRDPVASTSVYNSYARPTTCANSSSQIFSLLRNTSSNRASGPSGINRMVPRNLAIVGKVQAQMSKNTSGSMSQQGSGVRDVGTKWATVEEKKITRYFVEGRLIRQEEENVKSYKKIPAHWDRGIDVRDNYPSN